MKNVNELQKGDIIAFKYDSNRFIEASEITSVHYNENYKENMYLCHWAMGWKSCAEYIRASEVIAVGNPEGESKLFGWNGMWDLILPEHDLIKENKLLGENT